MIRRISSVSTKPLTARSNDDHLKWRGRESGTVRRRAKSCNDSLWQGSPSERTLHLSMSQWRERTATITLHVRLAREAEREMERTSPESTGMSLHMTDAARSHAKMCQLPRNQLHRVKSSHLQYVCLFSWTNSILRRNVLEESKLVTRFHMKLIFSGSSANSHSHNFNIVPILFFTRFIIANPITGMTGCSKMISKSQRAAGCGQSI